MRDGDIGVWDSGRMSADFVIEVYSMPVGPAPELPVEIPSEDPIAYLSVPTGGTVPAIGDLITLSCAGKNTERLKVTSRHHLAESTADAKQPAHVAWSKMWIFVSHA